jgi:hypothetical protein
MPPMTLSEAAQTVGKGKTTIWRAIKSGRLSASRGENGEHLIDPAELSRVFPPEPPKEPPVERHGTALEAVLEAEKAMNIELRERIAELRERLGDVAKERDRWMEQAETVKLLLAPPSPPAPAAKSGAIRRLFRRR